ncbi:MAG: hypothetical protein FWE08_02830 [Oscillospiraceae bacterium]|nr:hypothetical protein [Oscillospiraceae bacterium]
MKKVLVLLLIALMAFALVACRGGETEEPTEPDDVTETATVAPQEDDPMFAEEVVTVTYFDVSFSAPADATIIGGGDLGSAKMVIYTVPDTGQNATAILMGAAIEADMLEVLGEDAMLEVLLADDGEMVEMFGRIVVRNPREEGGYQFWFFNNDATVSYLLTVGDSADDFFGLILNTLSVSG